MHGHIIIMGSGDGFLMTRSLGKFALKAWSSQEEGS